MIRPLALCLILSSFAVSTEAAVAGDGQITQFDFATTRIGNFDIRAEVNVRWMDKRPYIASVECFGDNEDVSFGVDAYGQLGFVRFAFQGLPDDDGDRQQITLLGDRLWLYVDGKRYEYANIATGAGEFANYSYPRHQPGPDEIIVPVWRGHQAVRASEDAPFMHINRVYSDIARATKLEWGYKSRDWSVVDRSVPENQLPKGWEGRRYPVDHGQLAPAIDWCTRQVASDAAKAFPANLQIEEKQ